MANSDSDNTRTYVVLRKGTIVSQYRIVEKIGAGGMGEVFLAEDSKLSRNVALKFLPAHLCQDQDCRSRFVREAQAAAKLDHPNIITIYEVSEFQGRPFFAMQLVSGLTLSDLQTKEKPSLVRIIELIVQICDGLSAAHESGIIHRDIKPANIVVDKKGRPRLLDFGLAAVRGGERITKTGSTMGTVRYMSPEQAQGTETDYRSDLFSLGVVLYEMIAGRTPFERDNEAATLKAVCQDIPEPLARYKSDVPDDLQRTVSKLLEKDPSMRYQSAADLLSDLKRINAGGQSSQSTEPSIAVLPFANMSTDPEQEYFCDGIAEDIINDLTKIENLRVVARTSAFAFKGKNEDIRRIGNQLNVNTVLEGSVRKAGNRLRISAQLVNVADGFHIWSEKYDREMEDIFGIQDDISLAIVENLKLKLLGTEKKKLVKRYTDNVEAYHLYLKGRYHWNKRTAAQFQKAIEEFRKAIDCDPFLAPAYIGIADTYILQSVYCYRSSHEVMPLAKSAVTRALEIDDKLAEAHASLAHVNMLYDWDWIAAEENFKRSIKLNPGYASARLWYTLTLSSMGRLEEALKEILKARELDPLSLVINTDVGLIHFFAGRYDEAIREYQATLEIDSGFFVTHVALGTAYALQGNFSDALKETEKALTLSGDSSLVQAILAYTHAIAGNIIEARSILERLESQLKGEYISAYSIARVYVGLGENDTAFEWLDKAVKERTVFLIHAPIKVDPTFQPIKKDPRFLKLLNTIGLE